MNAYQCAYEYATARGASATTADEFAERYERFTDLVTQARALTGFHAAIAGPDRMWPVFNDGR
jgi:hypothetical protein